MGCRIIRLPSCSAFILLTLLGGCRAQQESHPDSTTASKDVRSDSLVVSGDNGLEVWFTLERIARGADGSSCVERALEIRHGETRVPVPLLYTGTTPVLLDQSNMRAELWNHCRPVAKYLVNLRTGQPVRERQGGS
jgi:hypothetical protein